MNSLFSGLGGFDPSKMKPETIAAVTELMGTLSHDQMMKMQSIMHNQMAGFDVSKEVAQFESTLPPSFRERMAKIMYMANGIDVSGNHSTTATAAKPTIEVASTAKAEAPKNMSDARLVILQSVSQGLLSPEEAMKVLFKDEE